MKDVLYQGKWRKEELDDRENPPFVLLPTGTLFKVLIWTLSPAVVLVRTFGGSPITAESGGEDSPAEVFVTDTFSSGDSIHVTVDADDDIIEKVVFVFDEDEPPVWGE